MNFEIELCIYFKDKENKKMSISYDINHNRAINGKMFNRKKDNKIKILLKINKLEYWYHNIKSDRYGYEILIDEIKSEYIDVKFNFDNDMFEIQTKLDDYLKIKACPFCGSNTSIEERQDVTAHGLYEKLYFVECANCLAHGPIKYFEFEALQKWNERR